MSNITFRSVDLEANGIHLALVRGYSEPASVRGADIVVPGTAGRTFGSRQADTRQIILEGYVAGLSPAEWRDATDTLMAALAEGAGIDPGALVIQDPYLGLSGGTVATIYARCTNILPGPISAMLFQSWSIELESVSPNWSFT